MYVPVGTSISIQRRGQVEPLATFPDDDCPSLAALTLVHPSLSFVTKSLFSIAIMDPPYKSTFVHREACDECHFRKVRCLSTGKACQNCISNRQRCVFSPRNPAGRPQKRTSSKANGTLPLRVPFPASNSALGFPKSSTSSPWQRQLPTPSPSSLGSSFSFSSEIVPARNR